MVVMLMLVVVFVMSDAVAEANLARQTRLGQKLERAIDGRLPDAGVFLRARR